MSISPISIPVAFYAPLKSPLHPVPSGDRVMARLLMRALEVAGFRPHLASEVRTWDEAGERAAQEALRAQSEAKAATLVAGYRALPSQERPRLWFTYHVYYKAPDWIGPRVADALGIPYVIAECSRSSKRAEGSWALGHAGAEVARKRADAIFVMTAHDRAALEQALPDTQILADLPPFIDDEWLVPEPAPRDGGALRLLTVAMMRHGDKLTSYRLLAEASVRLRDHPWSLTIVGDGDVRMEVERLFDGVAGVRFLGVVKDPATLRRLYEEADLFLWPAVNEAYGMVFLEAQARGCPVVAGAFGGVPSVVRDGETGRLTPPGDAAAFAAAVADLLIKPDERRHLGTAAHRFVSGERTLSMAARRLRQVLGTLLRDLAA